jgi:hypothetical protein
MTTTPNNLPVPEPLSPAAQAVRMDISRIMRILQPYCRVSYSPTDVLSITLETTPVGLEIVINDLVAAALCAVADQVVPEEPYCHEDDLMSEYIRRSQRQETRTKFLAIATELENHQ